MAKLKLPFELEKPSNNEFVTQASEIGYGGISVACGIIYDISVAKSVNNAPTKYESLSAALGTNGANIPQDIRRGGMSIKFIQSSDNKYIQARCMAQNFTTDVTQWQSMNADDEPTAGSNNLVKSGGVADNIWRIDKAIQEIDGRSIKTSFRVSAGGHSSNNDRIPFEREANSSIEGSIALKNGATISDGSIWSFYVFYSDSTSSHINYTYPVTNFSIVATKQIVAIGFYIANVTHEGTIEVTLEADPSELSKLEERILSSITSYTEDIASCLPYNGNLPNISTTDRTLTISQSTVIIAGKSVYDVSQNTVVNLSGFASSIKLVLYDTSNNSFTCATYNTQRTKTQYVLVAIRTDYKDGGLFTTVYNYSATFECTIDGNRAFATKDDVNTAVENGIRNDIAQILYGSFSSQIYCLVGGHSSTLDLIPIVYKAGEDIVGTISLGTAEWDESQLSVYLRDSNGTEIIHKNITIGTEFTISSDNPDVKYIGFYIYRVTKAGTFNVSIATNGIASRINDIEGSIDITPTGNYTGEKFDLVRCFKETSYRLDITSNLFDTSIYSVGNQSLAIYGNYAVFVRHATLRENSNQQKYGLVIVDLEAKTKLGEFVVNLISPKTHGNNISLGNKYDNNDILPLLYISSTFHPYECNVIRVSNTFDSYTLIQEVKYVGTEHFIDNIYKRSVDWVLDGEYIWAYGGYYGNANPFVEFVKFAKPPILNNDVSLVDADVLESFTLTNLNIAQGAFINNGKIYIGLGYNENDEWFKVIDIDRRKIISTIPLSYEPEGMTIYDNKVCICGSTFNLKTYESV